MPVQRSQRNQTLSISPEEMEMLRAGLHTPDRALSGEEMSNRVFSGDFFSIAEFLPERSVDLLILDPPYNLDKDFNGFKFSRISDGDYQEYIDRCLQRLLPVLKPSASVYLRRLALHRRAVCRRREVSEDTEPYYLAAGKGTRCASQLEKLHGRHLVCHGRKRVLF